MLKMPSDISKFMLIIFVLYFIYDTVIDYRLEGAYTLHFQIQTVMSVVIVINYGLILWARSIEKANLLKAEEKLSNITSGLAACIERQFSQWQLSKSEKEVAWLIIKGFSFSEIAILRKVKDVTIRQQATMIYSKSQVSNRSEFTASFLEDLINEPVSGVRMKQIKNLPK